MNKILNAKKGFTLIELLVVVAIIGVLASIILVGLSGFRSRGRDARRIADLRQVQNGLELYFTKVGSYPSATTWAGLKTALEGAGPGLGIQTLPNDPTTGATYSYCPVGSPAATSYVMEAILEGGNAALSQSTGFPTCSAGSMPTPCSTSGSASQAYCVTI